MWKCNFASDIQAGKTLAILETALLLDQPSPIESAPNTQIDSITEYMQGIYEFCKADKTVSHLSWFSSAEWAPFLNAKGKQYSNLFDNTGGLTKIGTKWTSLGS